MVKKCISFWFVTAPQTNSSVNWEACAGYLGVSKIFSNQLEKTCDTLKMADLGFGVLCRTVTKTLNSKKMVNWWFMRSKRVRLYAQIVCVRYYDKIRPLG